MAGPIFAEMGGGRAELRLTLDARQPRASAALAVKAQGVDVRPYVLGWGLSPLFIGRADLDTDLTGAGVTWHDLAAGLEGRLALTIVDGVLDTRLARGMVVDVLRSIRAGDDRIEAAPLALRCLSLDLSVANGKATVGQAGLDSARVFGTASGTADLGGETIALLLRPTLRTGQSMVAVPLRLDGGWAAPRVAPDPPDSGRVPPSAASDPCAASPNSRRVP